MKNNRAITLISLIITIIVLLILASITIYFGTESIKKAELENLKTNMLLIRAKAREYCEEANFKLGTDENADAGPGIEYLRDEKGLKAGELPSGVTGVTYDYVAELSQDNLREFGLKDVKTSNDDKYIIGFNIKGDKVEIYNTKGFDGKYSLTELEKIED